MSDNNKTGLGFFDWLSNNFSKPYLLFIFWWVIINLDWILVLIGKESILNSLITRYDFTIRTSLEAILNISTTTSSSFLLSVGFFHIIAPIIGIALTVSVISIIMNGLSWLSEYINERFEQIKQLNNLKNSCKQERNKLTQEHDEKIDEINTLIYNEEEIIRFLKLNSVEELKKIALYADINTIIEGQTEIEQNITNLISDLQKRNDYNTIKNLYYSFPLKQRRPFIYKLLKVLPKFIYDVNKK